ncbi:hypothetical protein I3843_08G084700 [Carya illinoinensis]|nr:hypothetical protein I3843_08G084700 [Carya illinoinensis]
MHVISKTFKKRKRHRIKKNYSKHDFEKENVNRIKR